MARPRLTVRVHRVHINLSLREEEDDDLIAFFEQILPRYRAVAIKTALRTGALTLPAGVALPDDEEIACALEDFVF